MPKCTCASRQIANKKVKLKTKPCTNWGCQIWKLWNLEICTYKTVEFWILNRVFLVCLSSLSCLKYRKNSDECHPSGNSSTNPAWFGMLNSLYNLRKRPMPSCGTLMGWNDYDNEFCLALIVNIWWNKQCIERLYIAITGIEIWLTLIS